jgi:hypothetical protein
MIGCIANRYPFEKVVTLYCWSLLGSELVYLQKVKEFSRAGSLLQLKLFFVGGLVGACLQANCFFA